MNKVPLMKSTSWADVEDENPPSPVRAPVQQQSNNPPSINLEKVSRIEPRPAGGEQRQQQPTSARRDTNNKPRGEGGKLWEPARPIKDPRASWRPAPATDQPSSADAKQEPTNVKKAPTKSKKPRERKTPRPAPMFELFLKFAPNSVTEDEIRKCFSGVSGSIKRIKRVGDDKAFVEFADKPALDQALTVKLPKWGGRDVLMTVATPPQQQQQQGQGQKRGDKKKPTAPASASAETSVADEKKPAPTAVATSNKATSQASSQPQKKKQPVAEAKRTNVFAALDTSSEEEEEDEDDEEEAVDNDHDNEPEGENEERVDE